MYRIGGIKMEMSIKRATKLSTATTLKRNARKTNFKNLYRARKKEMEILKKYLPVCVAQIDDTKREIRRTEAKESLTIHDEERIPRWENWVKIAEKAHFKLLEYIEEKEREISWFEPFV